MAVVAGFASMTAGTAGAAVTSAPLPTDGVWGIDFAGGTLNTMERAASGDLIVAARQISADGSTASARTFMGYAGPLADDSQIKRVPCDAGSCVLLSGAGNGDVGYVMVDDGLERVQIHTSPTTYHAAEPGVTGARIVDVSGRYFVYDAQSTAKQYIDDVEPYRTTDVRITRAPVAASVWGTQLWSASATAGAVSVTDIKTKKAVETVATGSACVIKELHAVGRWVYWSCGPTGRAGVYDRTAKKSFTVPSGPVLVGDGYLVQHDRTAGKLLLTDFHTGTSAAPRPMADLPAGNTADQRGLTWAVDKFGGDLAYVSPDHSLHIVPSGVPSQPLAMTESDVEASGSVDAKNAFWGSTWEFSKPVGWTFTVKDATGRTVRTVTGAGTAEAGVNWDGKTDAGAYSSNGTHTWTLTATAAEGGGTYSTSGKFDLTGGRPGFHDQGGFSYGELLTLDSKGALGLRYSEGKGTFNSQRSGAGWPAGAVVVPFGDMDTDRCAELLVRLTTGELRRYAGRCGEPYTPANSHTTIGSGWNTHNVLTAPGDLTGDGRTDLIARQASTGDLFLYADDGHGKLSAARKIGPGWSVYTQIVGAGDLNGDGFGDVLALTKTGALYRYDGTGTGTLRPRVTVSATFGTTYNTLVGVGDITGDGKNDVVMRDTAGVLYRCSGDGKGSLSVRSKLGPGWQVYKGLF